MKNKTLVFGASIKTHRYSNIAMHSLVANNIKTVAFGLRKAVVAGVLIDTELVPYSNIHTISLYMNPQRQVPFYNYLIALAPERVIFNPGTENMELVALLKQEGIPYEYACTLVLLGTNQY